MEAKLVASGRFDAILWNAHALTPPRFVVPLAMV
jgi:hypothetical protein